MKYRELEYSRTFNLGDFQSERITLKADLDETENLDDSFKTLKATVFRLQNEGKLIEESRKVVRSDKRPERIKQKDGEKPVVSEKNFDLTYTKHTGAKLGEFEIADEKDSPSDLYKRALNILKEANATINMLYPVV
mgnify:CR=1 FL=1